MANPTPKFDNPASASWSTAGPDGRPMPTNRRDFATLGEAVKYVRRMEQWGRVRAVVRSARWSYDAAAVEALEREMRGR